MAGIGFLLRKMVKENRYSSDIKASLHAVVISSGPWIFAVLCIVALNYFLSFYTTESQIMLFRAVIIYTYAFTLIISSIFQVVVTRFISDKLFQRENESLLPNFVGCIAFTGLVNFVISAVFMAATTLSFINKILCVVIFSVVGMQWIIVIFLTALRDYLKTTVIYFVGFLLSAAAAIFLGKNMGFTGFLLGFAMGQTAIVLSLMERILEEFPPGEDKIFEFTRYFGKYPQLFWAAFLYNFGFWIDKFLAWYSPRGFQVRDFFHAHYPYDTGVFLAVLTMIPALAHFFLKMETSFYEDLRRYINTIIKEGALQDINAVRKQLVESLKIRLLDIGNIQFLIAFILFLIAPWVLRLLNLEIPQVILVFRITLFAAMFQLLFLVIIVLFWYLELLDESAYCVLIFAGLNTVINYVLMYFTMVPMGVGYLVSIAISFFIALAVLMARLKDLNFVTLMRRPLRLARRPLPDFKE